MKMENKVGGSEAIKFIIPFFTEVNSLKHVGRINHAIESYRTLLVLGIHKL